MNPFARHPLRRYAFAWDQLSGRTGRHPDLKLHRLRVGAPLDLPGPYDSVSMLHMFERFPRLHRWVYSRRFGAAVYAERFEDLSNDLRGDMSVGKDRHTNYRTAELLGLLRDNGFEPAVVTGANLFWRWLQIPALLTGGPLRRLLERGIHLDGRLFTAANLFVAARRTP